MISKRESYQRFGPYDVFESIGPATWTAKKSLSLHEVDWSQVEFVSPQGRGRPNLKLGDVAEQFSRRRGITLLDAGFAPGLLRDQQETDRSGVLDWLSRKRRVDQFFLAGSWFPTSGGRNQILEFYRDRGTNQWCYCFVHWWDLWSPNAVCAVIHS